MNKLEFFTALRAELSGLPADEVEDIVRDQEEFIADAIRSGRTEADALAALGSPRSFAASLLAETRLQKAASATGLGGRIGNTWAAMLAMLAVLAPLNIILMLGPAFIAVCLLATGWLLSIASAIGAIFLFVIFFFEFVFISSGLWVHLSMFFLTIGTMGFTAFWILALFMLTRGFVDLTIRYLKWNLTMISSKP